MANNIFPAKPAPNAMSVTSYQPTKVSMTQSLKRQVRASGSHRFAFKLGYAPLTEEQYRTVKSFAVAQRGQFGTFLFVPHTVSKTFGKTRTIVRSSAVHQPGVTTVNIYGADAPLAAGDMVRFSNHSKCYEVVDANADMIEIVPPLMRKVLHREQIIYNDVEVTCAIASDRTEGQRDLNGLWRFTLDLVEVFS